MQFLSVSRRRTEAFGDAEFAAQAAAEVAQARILYSQGVIRQIWHRTDVPGACILLEADCLDQAREHLDTLPLVAAGMLEMTIIPLRPYGGFCPPS